MSLVKTADQAMKYEQDGKQTVSDFATVERRAYKKLVRRHSTIYTLWLLAVKHRVGLLAAGNIILVANWIFPEWPQLVLGLIGK